jgi:UDP-galactopyranose mutase
MTHLIVFSHLRWSFVFQRPQHLLSRLSRHYRVLYIEEPVHTSGPAHLERISHGPNLDVLVPHTPIEAVGFHDDQLPVLQPLIARYLLANDIEDCIAWLYTPMALPLLATLKPRALVYDCMDELRAFKNAPRQLRQRETVLLKTADLLLTGGPALYEAKHAGHPNAHCVPSCVDAAHFSPEALDHASSYALQAQQLQGHLHDPRLGFFGVIDERFDIALLQALADAHPQWQLVMVGPVVKIDPTTLPRRPNIHWLGMQSYELLPHLLAGWDVCLMPFAINEATRFISPTKTLEYMAGEKPIVSTPVHDVIALYGDVVRVAEAGPDFILACERMLDEEPAARQQRIDSTLATVERSSWDRAADKVLDLLQAAVEPSASWIIEPADLRSTPLQAAASS